MNIKRGYALLVTLFLLLSISIILSQILSIADKSLQDSRATQRYTQLFLLSKDISKILQSLPVLKDINTSKDFNNMLKIVSNIPIQLDKDRIIFVQIEPANRVININSLKSWSLSQKDIFLRYLRNKGLLMPEFFYDMLLDILKTKSNLTDIKRDMPSLNSGTISTWREFKKVEYYYLNNTKDYTIFQIPWKEIIGFEGNRVNINYISCEEWYLVLADNSKEQFVNDICKGKKVVNSLNELPLNKEQIENLKKFGLNGMDKTIKVSIKLPLKDNKDIITTFLYDIALKKVSNVSMAL